MTKLVHRQRAFAPKTKSGCKTCRIRRVKCDEHRPSCQKCVSGDRKCEWFEGATPTPPRSTPESDSGGEKRIIVSSRTTGYVPDPASADVQPLSLGFGLDARERSALGFFINRTARDLGYSFPSIEWISRTLQLGHEEPALRYAMSALGSMHQARRAYTHTSMVAVVDPEHLKHALDGYGKAMMALRRRIEECSVASKSQATNMILLSCLLFFCFEQLQGEQATACLHMQKGQRIVKELLSKRDSDTQIEPFLESTYGLFSGFEDINFLIFQSLSPIQESSIVDLARSIPRSFVSFEEANRYLKRLENARVKLKKELLILANEALQTLEAPPTDPAVVLCLQHCLSRAVDLNNRRELIVHVDALQCGYDAWLSALSTTDIDRTGTSHAWAVNKMQCLISRFNVRTFREPSEKICDLYEEDFVEALKLAEQCLLVYPSTNGFLESLSGALSSSGYGLALSTDLLPHIALCGFKSRRSTTRERAIDLLTLANKHDGVYQSAILARFVRRPMRWEEHRAMELGYLPGPDGFEAGQIPEEARVADSVFAQVKYRPRAINMIGCRYACNEAGESRIEISEDICDLFTGADISNTTYDIPTPRSCQQAIEVANGGFMIPSLSLRSLGLESPAAPSSENVKGILPMNPVPVSNSSSSASSLSSPSAPTNMHPVFSMGKDCKYSPWKQYPPRISDRTSSSYSLPLKNYQTMRIPAGTLPEESSQTEATLQPVTSRGHLTPSGARFSAKSTRKIPIMHCP